MSALAHAEAGGRSRRLAREVGKLPAFVRRDIHVTLTYRTAFVSSLVGLGLQILVLSWIGKLVDRSSLPVYGGVHVSYLAFVTIGMSVNLVAATLLYKVSSTLRNEQLIGTLESLLCTPTAIWTLQLGSAAGALVAIPFRIATFLGVLALVFGLDYHLSGALPAALLVIAFVPSMWGIGLALAGTILTFRRGSGATAIGTALLGLSSGAFFPLSVLPHWLAAIAALNPLTIVIGGLRGALLGGTGWAGVGSHLLVLVPISAVAVAGGIAVFELAMMRERRNGTLGAY